MVAPSVIAAVTDTAALAAVVALLCRPCGLPTLLACLLCTHTINSSDTDGCAATVAVAIAVAVAVAAVPVSRPTPAAPTPAEARCGLGGGGSPSPSHPPGCSGWTRPWSTWPWSRPPSTTGRCTVRTVCCAVAATSLVLHGPIQRLTAAPGLPQDQGCGGSGGTRGGSPTTHTLTTLPQAALVTSHGVAARGPTGLTAAAGVAASADAASAARGSKCGVSGHARCDTGITSTTGVTSTTTSC